MSTKVWFVLNVRFPTEKAYGVTTENTALAINKMSGFQACVVTPKKDEALECAIETIQITFPFRNIYERISQKNSNTSKVAFILWKSLYGLRLGKQIPKSGSILWLRDIHLALTLNLMGFQTICEVHRRPSFLFWWQLRWLNHRANSTMVYITEELRIALRGEKSKSVVAGMAVSANTLLRETKERPKHNFIIGYLGQPHSSGHKLSLDPVLQAAKLSLIRKLGITFHIIGITESELNTMDKLNVSPNCHFFGRMTGDAKIEAMDKFDAGLVIYPDTQYYRDSFPIKIVEYAARRIPILASDTVAHRGVMGNDKCLFFDLSSPESLLQNIMVLTVESNEIQQMVEKAYAWSEDLTYEKRARKIMKAVDRKI